jgi:glycosyltransferase involved in cell wall biosynthesis
MQYSSNRWLRNHPRYSSVGAVPEVALRASMAERPTVLINHLMEPPGRITGITRYLFSLLEQLVKQQNFQYVLATTWSAEQLPVALTHSDLRVETRPYHRSLPRNVMMQMVTIRQLMLEINAVAEFNCNPVGCFWPSWPRVITVHDLYFDVVPKYYRRRHRLWWNIFFPLALRSAASVICVSRSTQEDLRQHHPRQASKTAVVYEASTLHMSGERVEVPGIANDTRYAVVVGNISPNKNPACLASALSILENRGRPLTVLHVGRDEAGLLAKSVSDARLAHPIKSLGSLSDDALVMAYSRAMFMIIPSTHEGFCLPILEAQSCGTPIVCSDIPVLREVAGDAAVFFDPANPEMLADCIEQVSRQSDLRSRLSEGGRQNAAQFSWARAATETEAVLKSALGNLK